MLATMWVVLMLEISKHSMRRGGAPRPSASPSAAEIGQGIDATGHAETMALIARIARHRLRGLAQIVEHVAQLRRPLEIQHARRLLHLVFQRLEQFPWIVLPGIRTLCPRAPGIARP